MSSNPSPAVENQNPDRWRFVLALAITLVVNSALLAYFHNCFWWPPDEGTYAHTAARVLGGERLNKDVEEIHPGYVTFLNAATFKLFGLKLVSLRYPLVFISLMQSLLMFLIFSRHSLLFAVIAGVSAISIGVIQFLNPTPNWYCLFLTTLIIFCLSRRSTKLKGRLELVGFLLGLVFLLRQITGVFVAMGVLTYLLCEIRSNTRDRDTILAKALLGCMLFGTIFYLASATDSLGLLLFGIWPLAIIVQAILLTHTPNKKAIEILMRLLAGGVAAALPLLFYHAAQGSFDNFFDDTVVRALHVSRFAYLKQATYFTLLIHGFKNFMEFGSFAKVINGLYWVILPFIALIAGVATLSAFRKTRVSSSIGALPIIGVFYGMVSLLHQIPIYLSYSLPLSCAVILWLTLKSRKQFLAALGILSIVLSVISVYYHAGQPIARRLGGALRGDRFSLVPATSVDRAGLWVDDQSLRVYTDLVEVIRNQSQPSEPIFVLPNNPELYFLSDRRNPFRFWNSAIGVRNEIETSQVIDHLKREPPRLIVFAPRDRNNTQHSTEIMVHVREGYTLIRNTSDFEIYRSP